MKRKKPDDPDDPPDDEDLGWTFNNEIILNLQELQILRQRRDEVEDQSEAIEERIEGINAIKRYINRNRGS
jgi:hypothetical protein